jgi:pimeloyl-ACP methyl ester carboxylesterase
MTRERPGASMSERSGRSASHAVNVCPNVANHVFRHCGRKHGDTVIDAWVSGHGPAVVLMQYFRRNTIEHFREVIGSLIDGGFSVVSVDPRGVGGNSGSLEGLTHHDLAADVAAVVQELGVGPVHVFATAYAAIVAQCLAADHPSLVRSLILASPGAIGAPFPLQPTTETLAQYSTIFFHPDVSSEERRQAIQDATFAPSSSVRADLHDFEVRASDASALMAIAAATPVADWWAGGHVPVLILQGLEDRICRPENSRELRNAFGERAHLEDGHVLVREQPAEVARRALTFLRGGDGSRRPRQVVR